MLYPKKSGAPCASGRGDPLEIYTDAQGGVIFRKYSPVGELSSMAGKCAEVLFQVAGGPAIVCDGDHVVAAAGISKREVMERRISPELEQYLQNRKNYTWGPQRPAAPSPGRGASPSGGNVSRSGERGRIGSGSPAG